MQRLLLPGGLSERRLTAVGVLRPQPSPDPSFPPSRLKVIWLLAVTAPVTLVAHGAARRLRAARLVNRPSASAVTAIGSQFVAISFSALIVFALKLSSSSRVVIFTYALFSAVGLLGYRGVIWGYQRRRLAKGVYAKNVLLVGQPRGVEWMVQHFEKQHSRRANSGSQDG